MPSDLTSRRAFLAAAATATAAVSVGCVDFDGDDDGNGVPAAERWPQFGFDATNAAYNPDAEGPRDEPRVAWVHHAGGYYRNSTQPLVGEAVYANTWYDGLFALAPTDGAVRWHDERTYKALTPALADGALAVPHRDGLHSVAADGGVRAFGRSFDYERWRTDLDYPESPPTVADGVLVVGIGMEGHSAGGGRAVAVELGDGTTRWEYSVETSIWGAPAIADGVVYAVARDDDERDPDRQGTVHAIDLKGGSPIWSRPLGESSRFDPVDAPVVGGGLVYVSTGTGPLVALNADTGAEVWRFESERGVQSSPALADGVLYAGGLDGTLRAFDAETGETEWTAQGETYYGGPTVGRRGVYAVGTGGEVASWTHDGRERWRTRIDPPVQGSPVPADGRLFVGTGDGLLYALE